MFQQIKAGLDIFATQKNPDICAEHDKIHVRYDTPHDEDYNDIETLTDEQLAILENLRWYRDEENGGWYAFA